MSRALLEIQHLDKHFGGLHVLKDINISVAQVIGLHAGPQAANQNIFKHGQAHEGATQLKSARHAQAYDRIGLHLAQRMAAKRNVSFIGRNETSNQIEERGLACAVWAQGLSLG